MSGSEDMDSPLQPYSDDSMDIEQRNKVQELDDTKAHDDSQKSQTPTGPSGSQNPAEKTVQKGGPPEQKKAAYRGTRAGKSANEWRRQQQEYFRKRKIANDFSVFLSGLFARKKE